ncbi:glycoside hydrolase family 2 TIM barrel-domain containing protein [Bifidobacterium aerophilum]|nr:glycoside hydrolase family 2 TIM barrel-domain containing protein [Bifidobacterium aerophilum]
MIIGLEGSWSAAIDDGIARPVRLPGTLDTNGIGHPDVARTRTTTPGVIDDSVDLRPWATRLTRKHTFEGEARFTRHIAYRPKPGERVFFEVERARHLALQVDGTPVPPHLPGTLSTPHVFEVTGMLTGDDELVVLSDNSYPGMPHDAIVGSSTATDETQTNWNGLLGYVRLRVEPETFVSSVRVLPHGDMVDVTASVDCGRAASATILVRSDALADTARRTVALVPGVNDITFESLPLRDGVRRWDEYDGNLQYLTVTLGRDGGAVDGADGPDETVRELPSGSPSGSTMTVRFGVRDFGSDDHGRLTINGRAFFLRGEANCAEFPETGHPPTSVDDWRRILDTYRSYGVNCMRFHSHCPPDEAFAAADEIGMMMQPELSHWDPHTAFESDESFAYYRTELERVILTLANHPSFVMLTLGNELAAGDLGHRRMTELLDLARSLDPTRLYAWGSNVHYGLNGCDPNSDFYTSQAYRDHFLRATSSPMTGHLNNRYPGADMNYEQSMAALREQYAGPVFGFEVGQYEVLPELSEIERFQGVTDPANYRIIRDRIHARGLDDIWPKYVEASGELSLIGYREEVEAVLRTGSMSGLSLLGLQDFPGQGTALVGMLDAHLESKSYGFAQPERFRAFFTDRLPLALLPRYTYTCDETLSCDVVIANYGRTALAGPVRFSLTGDGISLKDRLPDVYCPVGTLTSAGRLALPLDSVRPPARLDLRIDIDGATNSYPIWVYAPTTPSRPAGVYETEHFDETARAVLDRGGVVYLSPRSTAEALPGSVQGQFSTDFWSVGTFPQQNGGMGQYIDADHPLFDGFPTESHTDWQWWPMAGRRAVVLPESAGRIRPIVTEMDSYAYLRPMAQLFECRCGNGRLLFSSMGLQDLQDHPEGRALQGAIYRYLASPAFDPRQRIDMEVIASMVR